MSLLLAVLLGIIQGLTEFLPISSTAHLTLAASAFGLIDPNNPERWTAFMAIIQLGTLAAVIVYFFRDLRKITAAFVAENLRTRTALSKQSPAAKMGWLVMIGTVPIVTVGLALKKVIEGNLTKDPLVIGGALIVLAVVLWIAERTARFGRSMEQTTVRDAIIVGLAQVLALFPGASRSGTTISAGLFLGLNRETAARFSFLLSIPAVLAAGLMQAKQSLPLLHGEDLVAVIVATAVSFVSGYASIAWLLRFLKTRSVMLFVYYRIALGLFVLGKGLNFF